MRELAIVIWCILEIHVHVRSFPFRKFFQWWRFATSFLAYLNLDFNLFVNWRANRIWNDGIIVKGNITFFTELSNLVMRHDPIVNIIKIEWLKIYCLFELIILEYQSSCRRGSRLAIFVYSGLKAIVFALGLNNDHHVSVTHRALRRGYLHQSQCFRTKVIIIDDCRWTRISSYRACSNSYSLVMWTSIDHRWLICSATDNKFTTFSPRGLLLGTSGLPKIFLIRCKNILDVLIHGEEATVRSERTLTISHGIIFLVNCRFFHI